MKRFFMTLAQKIKKKQQELLVTLQLEESKEEQFLKHFQTFVEKQIVINPTKNYVVISGILSEMKRNLLEHEGFKVRIATLLDGTGGYQVSW